MDREDGGGLYGGRGDADGGGRLLVVQDLHHQPMECFSDEVNSRNGDGEEAEAEANDGSGRSRAPAPPPNGGVVDDGPAASVESVKRRRGRPPGSKNKPKPSPVVTRDVEPAAAMRPHVLEIPSGGDVARALAGFARRRGLGICVLAGTGAVADVSLRHPAAAASAADGGGGGGAGAAAAVVVFRGRYEILSISATFLAPSMSAAVPARAAVTRDLSISLAGPHGQIVGGAVVGPLVAATTVVVLAAAFTDLTFHRLPLEVDAAPASVSGSGEADEHRGHGHHQLPEHHDASSGLHPQTMVAPTTTQPVPLYARQFQELWPPPASAQHPRPPYQ